MAAPGVNPLFPDAPIIHWLLSYDPDAMVEGHAQVWTSIKEHLVNIGIGTQKFTHNGIERDIQLLPQARGMFFIINLHGPDGGPPVPLAFNFHNLYLAAFQHENRWYAFDDADLEGSGHELVENADYWRYLGFGGGYKKGFDSVALGIREVIATYETLIRYDRYAGSACVERCCFRLIVLLPEAWRFPLWNAKVRDQILSSYSSTTVDIRGIPYLNSFENLFKSWSKICKRLNPLEFHTLPLLARFPEYQLLIPVVDVLLRPLVAGAAAQHAGVEEGQHAGGAIEQGVGVEEGQHAGAAVEQGVGVEEGQHAGAAIEQGVGVEEG